jgi:hypothetical protein
MLAIHLLVVLDLFVLTDGHLLEYTTNNASANYLMTWEVQSSFNASGILWPAMRKYIPCMAHGIDHTLGAFMGSLGVKDHTKSWEVHEHN